MPFEQAAHGEARRGPLRTKHGVRTVTASWAGGASHTSPPPRVCTFSQWLFLQEAWGYPRCCSSARHLLGLGIAGLSGTPFPPHAYVRSERFVMVVCLSADAPGRCLDPRAYPGRPIMGQSPSAGTSNPVWALLQGCISHEPRVVPRPARRRGAPSLLPRTAHFCGVEKRTRREAHHLPEVGAAAWLQTQLLSVLSVDQTL